MKSDVHFSSSRLWSSETNLWLGLLFVLVFYYAAARLGLLLAFEATNASPIWPPTGIAFAAVLLYGPRIWPAITIGACLANFAVFSANHVAPNAITAIASIVIAAGNTLEALIGAFLLRALIGGDIHFNQPAQIFKFSITVIVMCAVSAAIGTQTLMTTKLAPVAAQGDILLSWWLGDVGGALIVMPALLCWLRPQQYDRPARSTLEIALSLISLFGIIALVFSGRFFSLPDERLLLIFCFVAEAWAAYRFGRRGVTLTSLILAVVAVLATVNRTGPFTAGPLNDSLILLISFIALSSLSGLLLAADLAERDSLLKNGFTRWRELTSSWSALLIALSLTVLAWHLMSSDTERRASDQLHQSALEAQLRISKRLTDIENILRGAQGLFAASKIVEQQEWKNYIDKLAIQEKIPGILAIGHAPVIPANAVDEFVRDIHGTGRTTFSIWPKPEQSIATPILYIEPGGERNERALGYNMFSDASRRAAMMQARDSGEPVITKSVTLVQDTDVSRRIAALMYLPLYRHGVIEKSVDDRRNALVGFVYSAFRIGDLVEGATGHQLKGVQLEVFEEDDTRPDLLMYSNEAPSTAKVSKHRDAEILSETLETQAGQRVWLLRFTALPEFERTVDRQKAQLILIAGSIISLLLFTLMRSLALTTEQALRMADSMNLALRNSEERLRLLIDGVTDCAIFMLDPEGHVMSWNSGAEQIKGYRASEILGKHFSQFYLADDIARQHPQEILGIASDKGRFREEGWRVRKDGSPFWAEVNISALRDQNGKLRGFSKVTRDLSARKKAEEALYALSQRLSLATQAAGIGVWEWDVKTNVLSWDDQMYSMYQVDRATASNSYEMWRNRVLDEDIGRTEAELQAAVDNRGRFVSEFRIVLPNGDIRVISAIGACFLDEKGELDNLVGVNWDITHRKEQDKKIRVALEEKEMLLREVYHRVKNNLQVVISLFNLQINTLSDEVAKTALRESAERVRAMALVHEKLYESSNLASLPIVEYVTGLCRQIEASHTLSQRVISIGCDIEPIELGMDMAIPLGLLLNELISNCTKHAFPGERSGQIDVSLKRIDQSTAELKVVDNGIGLPPGFDTKSLQSLGIKLSKALARQLDGSIEFDNMDYGTQVRVTFKLSNAETSTSHTTAAPV